MSRCFCKKSAVVAAVMSNGHTNFITAHHLLQVVGVSLGRHADSIFIHPVSAHAHYTTQTAGTKLQVAIKRIG